MSYDLAVWEGPRPASDEAASQVFDELMDRMETGEERPASPAIRAYVAALLDRWPDISEDPSDDSPWASGPLIAEAAGNAIYFGVTWSRADEVSAFAADVAEQQGLVCYDPQTETLRPRTPRSGRSWFGRRR